MAVWRRSLCGVGALGALALIAVTGSSVQLQAVRRQTPAHVAPPATPPTVPARDILNKYFVTRHNARTKTAGLLLDAMDVDNVGPDADIKIGPRFKPFYAHDRGTNLGVSSWPGEAWKIGGGVVWGWLSYDPDLNLVYYGTSNPGPWNVAKRPGDNKWTASILARDADSAERKMWGEQTR